MGHRYPWRRGRLLTLAAALAALAGATPAAAATISVTESSFAIALAPSTPANAGLTTFQVHNSAVIAHALVIEGPGTAAHPLQLQTVLPGADATLEGTLQPGTYRIFCSILYHAAYGMDTTLQVLGPAGEQPPTASTTTASAIGDHGATLHATVDGGGHDVTYHFEVDTSPVTRTPDRTLAAGAPATDVSEDVAGLAAGTSYHAVLVATGPGGTARGASGTLRTTGVAPDTLAPTVTTLRPLALARHRMQLRADVSDAGSGVARVEVSLVRRRADGRCAVLGPGGFAVETCAAAASRFRVARRAGARATLVVAVPVRFDGTAWRLRVRATDRAGNVRTSPPRTVVLRR